MVDNRLIDIEKPSLRSLQKSGLGWFMEGENYDYLAPELLLVEESELLQFEKIAQELYVLLLSTAQRVAKEGLLKELGIPEFAHPLINYSIENELHLHLLGRFDFAGGLSGSTPKLLEFNADTFSLLPETSLVQPYLKDLLPRKHRKSAFQFNRVQSKVEWRLSKILDKYPQLGNNLLLSGLGYEEDIINLDVVGDVARGAGFGEVSQYNLPEIIFSQDEGIFVESSPGSFTKFDFWFKMVPWDFIIFEEPRLFEDLEPIIQKGLAVIMNPAWTVLLQSKALLKFAYDFNPNHPALLKTEFSKDNFRSLHYVEKPFFGRTGDNVKIYTGSNSPISSRDGDYGDFNAVYQAFHQLDQDEDGDIYQPSIFWAGDPAAMCFRRQDDLIIDDDAEFIGHFIKR